MPSNFNELSLFAGVDHPALAAEDPDALAAWYCEVLGYTVAHHEAKPVWLLLAADGTYLEIMPNDETCRPERTFWTPGWSHLALRVTDFDAAIRWLDSRAVRWLGESGEASGGGRVRSFSDPEGNTVQIVARHG